MEKLRCIVLQILLISIWAIGLSSCNKQESVTLRVMSYNIRHGEGMDGVLDLSRSAAIIKSQAPDLVGIQEVDNFCTRTDSIGQTTYLANETGMTGTFGKFMDFQGGEYGMATLSAKPIVSSEVLELPDGKYEPRSSLVHEIEIAPDQLILFANVHFDWISDPEGSANRLMQAKALVQYIDQIGLPSIIIGDFNCTPDSPTMQYFKDQGFLFVNKGEDNLSFQGGRKVEIDHVIYRNSENIEFKKNKVLLLEEPQASDHRPLIVELEVSII